MQAKLYGIPASNAVLTAQLALERKQIPYRRIDQLPVLHRITMRLRGFEGSTVPGIALDGRKVHGSAAILRMLDEAAPEPRLYPEDPERRATVDEAVEWGERIYQRTVRYLLPYSLLRRPGAVPTLLSGSRLSLPTGIVLRLAKPSVYVNSLINASNESTVRQKLGELRGMFDHVDELIGSGVLDAARPGAADLMIAPSTRAFLWWDDLRPALEGRPAAEHARHLAPNFEGEIPPVFPREALSALSR
jgi:glutathione S-transferase